MRSAITERLAPIWARVQTLPGFLPGTNLPASISQMSRASQADGIEVQAAALAFRFFLALLPSLILLVAAGGAIATLAGVTNPGEAIVDLVRDSIPANVALTLEREIDRIVDGPTPAVLSLAIVTSIWATALAVSGLVRALNVVYRVDEARRFVHQQRLVFGIALGSGAVLLTGAVVAVLGEAFAREIAEEFGLGGTLAAIVVVARWSLVALLAVLGVGALYVVAPNRRISVRSAAPGAVLFVVSWLLISFLFGLYVANAGSYAATYGTLGGIVVLLVWLYVSTLLLLLGAEVNRLRSEGLYIQ